MVNTSQTTTDVLELLKDDHDKVRALLKEMKAKSGQKRRSVLQTLRKEFLLHCDVEENIVYPAYKECLDTRDARVDVAESLDEHKMAKNTIEEMMELDTGSVQFDGKLKLLTETIEHHAGEEEENMFPEMRENCSGEQLRSLGRKVEEAKQKMGNRYG